MEQDFLQQLRYLGFTARIKRLNERIVSSTVSHYSNLNIDIEPNWHVIFLLLKERGKLTVTDIANTLGFSHPAMIKITRKMKQRGYLNMSKDSKDGRKTLIQLSQKGYRKLPTYEQEWNRIQEVLEEFVGNDFLNQLNELEGKLLDQGFSERYLKKFGNSNSESVFSIRNAYPSEFNAIGKLMVQVYGGLEGFPKADEQPDYYQKLADIGSFTQNPDAELLVATSNSGSLLGGVLYFGDMKFYGSGGTAPSEKNASGFRLLAVDPSTRGLGIGKALSIACINKAKKKGHPQVIIHSTAYMKPAIRMYKGLGFVRSKDLDFSQNGLEVYGYRLNLK
ncbi:GNAT family N-acetyltransferase [Flagellimonas flava]|uniref:DNA-binding transcriptional regulator, MarR family n=1 Tax=Flagellimonas flava TaxID=570519 RepID=A0A1M5I2D9_9FLAO|nr:GNAT family N-acetyltransferase [Allomuricauda flava]SHG22494.1 DNA-binding transcriptional regulator, MarR family [Allomuricauda flava]